jgi:hypothetical protein
MPARGGSAEGMGTVADAPEAAGEPPGGSDPSRFDPADEPGRPDEPDDPGPGELGADALVEGRVRHLVAGLDGIEQLPLAEHAQRYAEVHGKLQAALTELDGESSG